MKKVIVLAVLILAAVGGYFMLNHDGKKCELSLCDCSCYAFGKSPESMKKKECGINCMEFESVIGCKYDVARDECTEVGIEQYLSMNGSQRKEIQIHRLFQGLPDGHYRSILDEKGMKEKLEENELNKAL